ncbi:MAG: GNAT family N-acetyltransferase, partial [Thermoplasmata archaeon]
AEQNPRLAIYLDVMVEPSQRRHGLGRYLVRWGFRALSALGYTSVRLWVTEGNVPARTLYEALGFSRVASAIVYRESGPIGQPQLG